MNRTIYIGPARPYGLPLMNRAILLPGATIPGLDKAREAHPQLQRLFVPIENLAASRKMLEENGSPLQRAYADVLHESMALRNNAEGK